MSDFTSLLTDDTVLLTVTLIDAALLIVLALITIENSTSVAARSFLLASLVFAVLVFLFLQDQYLGISEPSIEALQTAKARYS